MRNPYKTDENVYVLAKTINRRVFIVVVLNSP